MNAFIFPLNPLPEIQLYDTAAQHKRPLVPRTPGEIALYVCGMTVYDYCHVGHGRVMVNFDVLVRYLRAVGYQVTYVRNITDIDDKIINRAAQEGCSLTALTERYIEAMQADAAALSTLPPDHEPRATVHIVDMIAMISALLEGGYAYVAASGDVYYEVEKFPMYGALAHKDLAGLQAGHRVDVVAGKRGPLDFVLWKLAKPGEPEWPSPWGAGRPGWHIECAAMSKTLLGLPFDLHGGGIDLLFPHHQNELAQAEAACGCQFVNHWLHVGHIRVDDEKMSKSLGNFFTLRDVFTRYSPEVVRYFMVASHYRSPVNYSEAQLQSAKGALQRMYTALAAAEALPVTVASAMPDELADYATRFCAAMNDDLNTPEALAVLFELARGLNRSIAAANTALASAYASLLRQLGGVLGLLQQAPSAFLQGDSANVDAREIDDLVAARDAARAAKQWAEADKLRAALTAKGVVLEDSPKGTRWRYAG